MLTIVHGVVKFASRWSVMTSAEQNRIQRGSVKKQDIRTAASVNIVLLFCSQLTSLEGFSSIARTEQDQVQISLEHIGKSIISFDLCHAVGDWFESFRMPLAAVPFRSRLKFTNLGQTRSQATTACGGSQALAVIWEKLSGPR